MAADRAEWEQAVTAAVGRIKAGELRKVVLARDLHATASEPIDIRILLARLAARAPGCFTFACAGLVGATPELLIRREGRDVNSLVLAGTMARGGSKADDEALSAALLASAKNAEEHGYSVESVRDLLTPLCTTLSVDPAPFLLQMADYQHLATSVTGELAGDTSALALAASLHPTAAICGTPTRDGAGADPGAGGDGARPVLRPGRLGRRARQRRMGHRAALRRDRGQPGPAIRRLRHRGRIPGRIRAGRVGDEIPADAPGARRLSSARRRCAGRWKAELRPA